MGVCLNLCRLCRQNPCDHRCPNYIPPKSTYYCSICGGGIYPEEEYIKNLDGEYRHYECFHEMREFIEWLGFSVETMD